MAQTIRTEYYHFDLSEFYSYLHGVLGHVVGEFIIVKFFSETDLALALGVESTLNQSTDNTVMIRTNQRAIHARETTPTTLFSYIALNLSMSARTDSLVIV